MQADVKTSAEQTVDDLASRILSGEISSSELTGEQLIAWINWEPTPVELTSFDLSNEEQRKEFLWEYYWQGETTLFSVVAHVWDSLEGQREAHCTLVGLVSGTGGKGKTGLILTLQKFLRECLDGCSPLPSRENYASLEEWNDAVRQSFIDDEQQARERCKQYSAILDGRVPEVTTKDSSGQLLKGNWK